MEESGPAPVESLNQQVGLEADPVKEASERENTTHQSAPSFWQETKKGGRGQKSECQLLLTSSEPATCGHWGMSQLVREIKRPC